MALAHDPDLIELLADLVDRDRRAVLTYDEAIDRCEDPTASSRLWELRAEHERHVRELSECLVELGGEPPRADGTPCADGLGDARGTRAILLAMHACEQTTHDAYRQVLVTTRGITSPRLREVLERCFEDERRHTAWLATQVA